MSRDDIIITIIVTIIIPTLVADSMPLLLQLLFCILLFFHIVSRFLCFSGATFWAPE